MKRIVLLDDDPDILDVLSFVLKSHGYEVYSYAGYENNEALMKMITEIQPSVIVSDVYMPVANGKELCLNMKNNSKTKNIPFILMSAAEFAGKDISKTCADEFIKKPFDMATFEKTVEHYIAAGAA